ncbi:hypothetical protein BV25DRAFT_1585671 [Artomyces pyxidatus]|uniref:Uncharacterized protein n=1 Tax=Artomyces pyxidatus TaxID=48021 RepID=A0ACB8TC95_9AGAM|nr:hypothetical protein BV25DRAFT_1585671 [Artomyces pyxidatus]
MRRTGARDSCRPPKESCPAVLCGACGLFVNESTYRAWPSPTPRAHLPSLEGSSVRTLFQLLPPWGFQPVVSDPLLYRARYEYAQWDDAAWKGRQKMIYPVALLDGTLEVV